MASAGTAFVNLEPDLGGFFTQVEAKLSPLTDKFGTFGKAAAVGVGAIAVAGAAAGKALYDIGSSFDDAYDTIRVKTGATGKELEGLEGTFKNVVSSVPTDFDSAAKAVGELNARLDITGRPLQSLSKQMLELSRITNTDLETNIESITRVFGDWGVAVKDQGPRLDELYRASQETGVGVARLADLMTKFGSPLRQLGFSFTETAGLVGKFEKEGVNTELVLGSMRIALGKLASEGVKDPAKALQMLTEQIKGAGSAGKANALAIETFGARAGPDMAAAIREGRFDLGKLFDTIKNGSDTVMKSGRETRDFSEQWQMFKNKVLVALEPLALRVFNAVGDGMKWLNKNWPAIVAKLVAATDWLKKAWLDIGPAIKFVANLVIDRLASFEDFFAGTFKVIRGLVDVFVAALHGDFKGMWDGIKRIFEGMVKGIIGLLKGMTQPTRVVAGLVAKGLLKGFEAVGDVVGMVKDALDSAIDTITDFLGTGEGSFYDKAKKLGGKIVSGTGKGLADFVSNIADKLKKGVEKIGDWFQSFYDKALRLGGKIVNGMKSGFSDLVTSIADKLRTGVDKIGEWFQNFYDKAEKLGGKIVGGMKSGFVDLVTSIADKLKAGIDKITEFITDVAPGSFYDKALKLGGKIVSGLKDGVGNIAGAIGGWVKDAISNLPDVGKSILNYIIGQINNAIPDKIPLPKLPDIDLPDNPIPLLASGVTNFAGGMAIVGEEGPELVNLPRGSDVIPAPQTAKFANRLSGIDGRVPDVNLYIEGDASALDYRIVKITRGEITEHDHRGAQALRAGLVRA